MGANEKSDGTKGHDQRCYCRSHCCILRIEEVCLRESAQRSCRGCNAGGQEDWRFCASRLVQAEDAYQACHKGRKAGSVWQGGDGQSEASQEDREGVPSRCFEIKHLSRHLPLYLEPLSVGHPAEWSGGCWLVFARKE